MDVEQVGDNALQASIPLKEWLPVRRAAFMSLVQEAFEQLQLTVAEVSTLTRMVDMEPAEQGMLFKLSTDEAEWLARCFDRVILLEPARVVVALAGGDELRVAIGVNKAEQILRDGIPPDFA